jgi:hypothetical protein
MRGRSTARDDFEDFEFLAVGNGVGDGDGGLAAHDDDRVGPYALRAKDFLDRGPRKRKLDFLRALVEPAADGDFGRNPSCFRGGKRLRRKLLFKASPREARRFSAEVA